MKSLFKVAGIILAAIFAVSMFASASASAASWEQCATEKAATNASKYTSNQCTTASSTGGWAWQTAPLSEAAKTKGSLLLADTKLGIEVECYGEGNGTLAKVETVTVLSCRTVKGCEASPVPTAEARDLPWKTEQYDTEGKKLELLKEEGKGQPGWAVTCNVLKVKDTDVCTTELTEPESLLLANVNSGTGGLLVLATFQQLRTAKCTLGGAHTGRVTGSVGVLKTNGWGLRVT